MALPKRPQLVHRTIGIARHQLGTPYVWGGSAPGGFDCSGLVYYSYTKAGYRGIGRTTYQQIKQGIAVPRAALRPGDIIFPSVHHEGLYIGNGMVLEAPHTGDHVKIIPLSQFGFLTARRLVRGGGGVVPPRAIGGQNHVGLPIPHPNPIMRVPMQGVGPTSTQTAIDTLNALLAPHNPASVASAAAAAPASTMPANPNPAQRVALQQLQAGHQQLTNPLADTSQTLADTSSQLGGKLHALQRQLVTI
jgi:hypothetical protein